MGEADGDCEGPVVGPALGDVDGLVVGDAVGVSVSHVPSSLHAPLRQSRPATHFLPSAHGGHAGPPQSAAVSSPFKMPSRHVADVGENDGDALGDVDGAQVGDTDGDAVGSTVVGDAVGASVLSQQSRNVAPSPAGQQRWPLCRPSTVHRGCSPQSCPHGNVRPVLALVHVVLAVHGTGAVLPSGQWWNAGHAILFLFANVGQ